jgi:cyclopropane fatty-acyl-phospholipid synthase-like methyltransferase
MTSPHQDSAGNQSSDSFDDSYEGTPPWDIGRPQRQFVLLEDSGEVKGSILDVGCGTGENSLFFASRGHDVTGIDFSIRAIEKARTKAAERNNVNVDFHIYDVLNLSAFGRSFDNAIDSGLFHVFSDEQRSKFITGLHSVLKPGGKYFMMCFSDKEPKEWGGPRRILKGEIEETFSDGWQINYIREAKFETNFSPDIGQAWFSSIARQ